MIFFIDVARYRITDHKRDKRNKITGNNTLITIIMEDYQEE